MTAKRNVIVLMGGLSEEHDVSLATGRVVLRTLDKRKYNVSPVIVGKNGRWLLAPSAFELPGEGSGKKGAHLVALDTNQAISRLRAVSKRAAVVFIALHGRYGEDGTVQGFLDVAGIPYTGSGVLASALAMDKVKSAELFRFHGLTTPPAVHFTESIRKAERGAILGRIAKTIGFPCVVKPSDCGSSVGITVVSTPIELANAVRRAFLHSATVLVQKRIRGTEVTCAVLDDGNRPPIALPPTEIVPLTSPFFDYHAKYAPGATEEITPARLPAALIGKIQKTALKAHTVLGCSGMSRTDMILLRGKCYVLETNTIPGMTEGSLLPKAAAAAGIPFQKLLDRIIAAALRRTSKLS